MKQYLELLKKILDEGTWTDNRTGVRCKGLWGETMRFDLSAGFPLVTTKKIPIKSMVTELLFFIKGYTDVRWLQERGCRIWNEWATKEQCEKRGLQEFDLGPVYGWQWRHFGAKYTGMKGDKPECVNYDGQGVDQLMWVQDQLRNNPNNRQVILSAWNPVDFPKQALPPCHVLCHFRVINGKLNTLLLQRSCDSFLGVPWNISGYALLTHLMAQTCNLQVGTFVHVLDDVHIYENHVEQVKEQLSREPRQLPNLKLNTEVKNIQDFTESDIEVIGYHPYATIKAQVAV